MKKEYVLIIYGVIAVIVIIFLTAILKKLGIFKSKAKKEQEANIVELHTIDYFNPAYYKTVTSKMLPENQAKVIAQNIRKATRGFGTNEERIWSMINQLYNRTNISQVAEQYYLLYKRDLKTDMLGDLSKKEQSLLMELINKKPDKI